MSSYRARTSWLTQQIEPPRRGALATNGQQQQEQTKEEPSVLLYNNRQICLLPFASKQVSKQYWAPSFLTGPPCM